MLRRIVDIAAAAIGLVLLSPIFLVVAPLIRADSAGNPFYGGTRIGQEGRPFRMWKFRTMVTDADRIGGGITAKGDARITRIGRFLRATKMDELPQLLNLLTGDLTLVGPRAEVPHIVERYTPKQRETLRVKPGITGPGQIYFTTDQADSIPEGVSADDYYAEHLLGPKLDLDLAYLRRRTVLSDLKTIAATLGLVARSLLRGAR